MSHEGKNICSAITAKNIVPAASTYWNLGHRAVSPLLVQNHLFILSWHNMA